MNGEYDKRMCPQHKSEDRCKQMILPLQDAMDVLSGKWKIQIILSLTFGRKRFKQIIRDIPGLTPKMLSKQLKDLEINGLVARYVQDTVPVTVEYELTEYGHTLKPVLRELKAWGSNHRDRIIDEMSNR